jgi:hypothetical protein
MTTIERAGLGRRAALGAAVLATVAVALIVGLLLGPEHRVDSGDVVFLAVMLAAGAAVWALALWAGTGTERARRLGPALAAIGMLGVVVFWTGLPLVLGAAAVLLGRIGRSRTSTLLGWLAITVWLFAYLFVQDFFPALSAAVG